MAQAPVKCTSCGRPFNPAFPACPFCKALPPAPSVPKAAQPAILTCASCGRQYNPSFTSCPFCKAKGSEVTPPTRLDYAGIAEEVVRKHAPLLHLDFSPASVLALDLFSDMTWGTEGYAPTDENWSPKEGQVTVIVDLGIYFGEVLRRQFKGHWEEDPKAPDNPIWSTVVVGRGLHLNPLGKVYKRLKNGVVDAYEPFFFRVRQEIGSLPSPSELDGWLAQGAFFEKSNRPDISLQFYERALTLPITPTERLRVEAFRSRMSAAAAAAASASKDEPEPSTPEPPPDFAGEVRAVEPRLRQFGVSCDFSPASLAAMDFWLDATWGTDSLSPERRGDFGCLVWPLGCYMGETVRRRLGGEWQAAPDEREKGRVILSGEVSTCPFEMVAARMEGRAKGSLHSQFERFRALAVARGIASPAGDESSEWYAQARNFADAPGRFDLALAFANHALKIHPDQPAVLSSVGNWLLRTPGREEQAARCYERALALDPWLGSAWLGKSHMALAAGKAQEALSFAEKGFQSAPGEAGLLLVRADALLALGRIGEARLAFESVPALDGALAKAGACAEALGDTARALRHYLTALQKRDDPALWLRVGHIRENNKELELALETYRRVAGSSSAESGDRGEAEAKIKAIEDSPALVLDVASRLAGEGSRQGALDACDRLLRAHPDCVEGWCERGVGLVMLDRAEEALASFDRAIALAPGEAKAYDHRAVALMRLKRFDEALATIGSGLAHNPANVTLLRRKGVVLFLSGRYEEAAAAFGQALVADPSETDALCYRAESESKLGRTREAIASLQEYVRRVPARSSAVALKARQMLWGLQHPGRQLNAEGAAQWHDRAFGLLQAGDLQGALAAFDASVEADPFHADAWSNRGTCLMQLGRHEEALLSFDRALDLTMALPDILRRKAACLQALGRPDEALACHDLVLVGQPREENSLGAKAALLYLQGRFAEELECREALVALHPTNGGTLSEWADCLRRLGRRDEALHACDLAIAAEPGDRRHQLAKSLVLSELGRKDEALALQREAFSDEAFSKELDEEDKRLAELVRQLPPGG